MTTIKGTRGSTNDTGDGTATKRSGAADPELYGCAALLGIAILVAEGELAGPLVATFLAVLTASVALCFWLIRAGSFVLPAGLGWLMAVLMIGSVSAAVGIASGQPGNNADLVRDLLIALAYIGFLLVGYYYGRERSATSLVWWVLIVIGGVNSVIHLWLFTGQITSGVSDVYILRLEAGRGTQVQLAAVVATWLVTRGRKPGDLWTKVAFATAGVCVLSITLALSRLLIIELVIVAMIFSASRLREGSDTLEFRVLRAIGVTVGGLAALSLAVFSLRFISETAYTFVYDGFIEKLLNSYNEVASTQQQSLQDIDENYRAFESERGLQLFSDAGWFGQWFGQGWGTAVPLGLDTASTQSNFVRTEAAFLHNGYINYLVKVGIAGLAAYLAFMVRLIYLAVFEPVRGEDQARAVAQRQALIAVVLCLAVGSLTGGGFGFPAGFLSTALLLGTCMYTPTPGRDARVFPTVRSQEET